MNPQTPPTQSNIPPVAPQQPVNPGVPPQPNPPIYPPSKKPKNRKLIIGLVILAIIVVGLFIPAGYSSKDDSSTDSTATSENTTEGLANYANKYFSVSYPTNFDKEEFPATVATTQGATFSEKNYGDGYMIAGAEATTSATFSKDIKDYQDFINQSAAGQKIVDQQLTETTLGGVKGPQLTWTTQDSADTQSQKKSIYIQSKKDGELYTLSISYKSTNTAFEKQIPSIIDSFKIK